jgi:cytochrome P450
MPIEESPAPSDGVHPVTTVRPADAAAPRTAVRYRPVNAKPDHPWQQLAADRRRCPVGFSAELDAVQVTSRAGVKEVLRDPYTFVNRFHTALPRTEPLPADEQVLAFADPPRHTRQRRLLAAALSRSRVESLRPYVRRIVDDLVDDVIANGTANGTAFDLVDRLARPLPVRVVPGVVGVPPAEAGRFSRHAHLIELATALPGQFDEQLADWTSYVDQLVRQRRAAGSTGEDLISVLCRAEVAGERFTDGEVAQMVLLLVGAGLSTTTALIGNTVVALEGHPAQKARFTTDPDAFAALVVEEGLRFDGPIHGLFRTAVADATILGAGRVHAGGRVYTCYSAANHDPADYDRPDEFVLDRDWAALPPHLAFGYGVHHCVGTHLARLEAQLALSVMYRRLPNLRMRPGFTPAQLPGAIFRGWTSVEMVYDPPALPRETDPRPAVGIGS